jgi:hypothetical protein
MPSIDLDPLKALGSTARTEASLLFMIMNTNSVLAAIQKVIDDIDAGRELPSITIDTDSLPEMDEDDIAFTQYAFDHWDD